MTFGSFTPLVADVSRWVDGILVSCGLPWLDVVPTEPERLPMRISLGSCVKLLIFSMLLIMAACSVARGVVTPVTFEDWAANFETKLDRPDYEGIAPPDLELLARWLAVVNVFTTNPFLPPSSICPNCLARLRCCITPLTDCW